MVTSTTTAHLGLEAIAFFVLVRLINSLKEASCQRCGSKGST